MENNGGLSYRKRVAFWCILLFVAAGMAFLAGEVVVRIVTPQPKPMKWLEPVERYGHVMKPDFHQDYSFPGTDYVMEVQTNRLGLRDEEPKETSADMPTILFMGDSFTFGFGVDVQDRFDRVLARRLEDQSRPVRSINTGTPAWGTIQATRFVADRLDQFNPDVIVLTFCSNDSSDDAYFLKKGQSFDAVVFPGKRFLTNNSHLYRYLTHRAFTLLHQYYVARKKEKPPEASIDVQSAALISEEQWERTFETLDGFLEKYRTLRPNGSFLVQASSPTHADTRSHLEKFAQRPGVVFVDLYDKVHLLPLEEQRLPYDGHWSLKMHEISGEALAAALLQHSRNQRGKEGYLSTDERR